MAEARVELREPTTGRTLTSTTDAQGAFNFPELPAGNYAVRIRWHNKTATARKLLRIQPGDHLTSSVQVPVAGGDVAIQTAAAGEQPKASGGRNFPAARFRRCP